MTFLIKPKPENLANAYKKAVELFKDVTPIKNGAFIIRGYDTAQLIDYKEYLEYHLKDEDAVT